MSPKPVTRRQLLKSGSLLALPVVENEPYGTILLEYDNCNSGSVAYEIPSLELQGVIDIQRISRVGVVQLLQRCLCIFDLAVDLTTGRIHGHALLHELR